MTVSISVKGVTQAIRSLKKSREKSRLQVARALEQSSLFLKKEVVLSINGHRGEDISFDTGFFSRSIQSKSDSNKLVVWSDVSYATKLEYGKGARMRGGVDNFQKSLKKDAMRKPLPPTGRRHFRNSLDRNREKIRGFINNKLKSALK
jgi:hypothetical protein